jgi:hypothetical protein
MTGDQNSFNAQRKLRQSAGHRMSVDGALRPLTPSQSALTINILKQPYAGQRGEEAQT